MHAPYKRGYRIYTPTPHSQFVESELIQEQPKQLKLALMEQHAAILKISWFVREKELVLDTE